MITIICEKPSAKRNFEKAITNQTVSTSEKINIVCCIGHLFSFVEPSKQVSKNLSEAYSSWDNKYMPWNHKDIKFIKELSSSSARECFDTIRKSVEASSEIVIGTDNDPSGEGDLIAWEVLLSLDIKNKKITRMRFVDETSKELVKAFNNRTEVNYLSCPYYIKADARSKFDFLTMQETRIVSSYNKDGVLRVGRLKGYMVNVVGKQLELIKSFVPEPFFEASFVDNNGNIYREEDATTYKSPNEIKGDFSSSPVSFLKEEEKEKKPPKLLDLSLLTSMIVPLGFTAKEVSDTYQKLYQDHFVSYPRTEDKTITPEQFFELLEVKDKIADVVGINKNILTHLSPRNTFVKAKGAHGANRPTTKVPPSLQYLEENYGKVASIIYKLLARSFLSILCEDYKYKTVTFKVDLYPTFICKIDFPISLGYKVLYPTKEESKQKMFGNFANFQIYEGTNKAPETPTMKWLMKQLEKNDVGTGATRTSTYIDVTSKSYKCPLLDDKKGKLTLSSYGELLYKLTEGTYISSLTITKDLAEATNEIAKGNLLIDSLLFSVSSFVSNDMEVINQNAKRLNISKVVKEENLQKKQVVSLEEYSEKNVNEDTRVLINWKKKQLKFKPIFSSHIFTKEELLLLASGEEVIIKINLKDKGEKVVSGLLKEKIYNKNKYLSFEISNWKA